MPPLYVIQQSAKLHISNRRLHVDLDGETQATLPLAHVSQVILFGNIGLTTPAIDSLLAQGIEVVFLTQRGEYRGRLVGSLTPHVPMRRAQYQHMAEPAFVLGMASGFVAAKLQHQLAMLNRHNRDLNLPEITSAASRIRQSLAAVEHKTSLSSLLGLEGATTAAYFSGFRCLLDPAWKFDARNPRPPRDPGDVLLSLGYTLLTEITKGAVQAVGLDPYAGYLHEVAYNRPALALDIVEEFRPMVDGIVLWCCRGGQITPNDFSPGTAERPVMLEEEGLRRFLKAFEDRLEQRFTHPLRGVQLSLRQCLQEQARQVATRLLEGQSGYQGMGFR
jgi:CRISP-associated protein Cas1